MTQATFAASRHAAAPDDDNPHAPGLPTLAFSALGVVFGDIGTSPLYTFKTVLNLTGPKPSVATALGALSLIVWTLIVVATIKYVFFAMRADNHGEGGILALMSQLVSGKRRQRIFITVVGLFGAALIYGDGAITPAISVLSALEGLKMVTTGVEPYVLPAAVVILAALFAVQPLGTAFIGRAFGPVMALWFVTIGVLGLLGVLHHPGVVAAINPIHGLSYLATNGLNGFLVLGGVFLCVTGAEAMYADMGHFGAKPIRLSWLVLVFPCLLLNYAGQAALVIGGAPTHDNIFFRLCPSFLLVPMVILATLATIIASQSIITGAFSMTRQAIQLGWVPAVRIKQTSAEGYGQIYVGVVNWALMIVTIGLTIGFGKSDNLASAYGVAVSLTMLMTTALLFIAMRELWHWSLPASIAVAGFFLLVDMAFVAANLIKILEGGYVPLVIAIVVFGLMYIWHKGAGAIARNVDAVSVPVDEFLHTLETEKTARVPGTAIFLSRSAERTPLIMQWHVAHSRALHQHIFTISTITEPVPWISMTERLDLQQIAPGWWRGVAHYGFMDRQDLPHLVSIARGRGCELPLDDIAYYVGRETVVARKEEPRMPRWQLAIFAVMTRNTRHIVDFFHIPSEKVVEIGRQIAI